MLRILFVIWLSLNGVGLSLLSAADVEPVLVQALPSEAEPIASESRLPLRELRLFTQVFEQIRRGYVEEVSDSELLNNAIAGLLLELDPHSVYLDIERYSDLQENATGE